VLGNVGAGVLSTGRSTLAGCCGGFDICDGAAIDGRESIFGADCEDLSCEDGRDDSTLEPSVMAEPHELQPPHDSHGPDS